MTSGQPKRKRGVVLTPIGRQKLQEAIKAWEEQDNFGDKLTVEELSDRTKLDAGTVAKVLNCEEGVDRRTLERFFQAFNLELTQDDYGKPTLTGEKKPARETRIDWGEAVDVSIFYGRIGELGTLEQWIVSDRCRLVALLGMGGIGKTSLAAKLGEQIQGEFDYVVWRSLREAPPLKEILTSLIQFLSNQQETEVDLPESMGGRITKLLEYLRSHRCLLILDNAESILQEGQAGVCREGYEGYGELLKRVGESVHQSCLVVTSREKPRELSAMEGEAFLVRSLQLRGVEGVDGQEILRAKGLHLSETNDQGDELIHRCAGNPLALKLVATTIQDLFDGDIAEFLSQETIAFEGVRDLLDQHFDRLSEMEKSVMYWLAINREPISVQELQEDIVPPVTKPRLLEALKGLVGRSLAERRETHFTLQNVVMEYIANQLIEQINQEIKTGNFIYFKSHAFVKATAKEHIRETQTRLVVKPVVDKFESVEQQLILYLKNLKAKSQESTGYEIGNILNLLCYLNTNLSGYDLSHLKIRQAYLQGINLHNVDVTYSDFSRSVFTETFGSIVTAAFSSDGRFLATGDATSEIQIWRIENYEKIAVLEGHTDWVLSVTFSQADKILISGGSDLVIRVWDIKTGLCLKTLQGHTSRIHSIDCSPDGKSLASSSQDSNEIRVWDVETEQCLRILEGHTDGINRVAYSPNGQNLVSCSRDQTIRIWNSATGECILILKGHTDLINSIIYSPDGRFIASGGGIEDQTVKLWNSNTGECLRTLRGHTGSVRTVTLSHDSQILASSSHDTTIKIWNINSNQCLKTLQGHTNIVRSVVFSPDASSLISCSSDQTIKVWSTSTGQCLRTLRGYIGWISSVCFSPNGNWLVSGSESGEVRLWDIKTGECLKAFQHDEKINSISFNLDEKILVATRQSISLLDANTIQYLKSVKRKDKFRLFAVSFSFDSRFWAGVDNFKVIQVYRIDSGQKLKDLEGHTSWICTTAFSPDGKTLASGGNDRVIKVWGTNTGQCIRTLQGHTDLIRFITYSPDGEALASGSEDYTIRLWNIKTGKCTRILRGHTHRVKALVFHPDGKTLISGSEDNTARLWNLDTGECIRIYSGHSYWVNSVMFHPEGKMFASGSQDGTIKLWNVESGVCLKTMRAPRPYEGMDITGVTGLSEAQKASLLALGAIESQ